MKTNTQKTVSSATAIRSFRGKYAFLSNMYECPVEFGGMHFTSAEAAFQAQKTLNLKVRENFCALNPQGAKKFGKSKSVQLRPDWESAKLGIMADVVYAKFSQNKELKDLLLATGDVELVEGNNWGDTYWGVDSVQGGENKLGKILMKVRSDLDDAPWSNSVQSDPEERERIQNWKRSHGEAVDGVAPSVVDNSGLNAPATKNGVLLDAEREDSNFDYRRGEDILSCTETESYEDTRESLLDDSKDDISGYHKATLVDWAEVKGCKKTRKDGSVREYKPYIALTFRTENGFEFTSRAYSKYFGSFKMQANYRYKKLFTWMKDSVALDQLKGKHFDIWVHYNDLLGKYGEWQAEYYDKAAYAARKHEQAVVGTDSVRSGSNNRQTEDKATR